MDQTDSMTQKDFLRAMKAQGCRIVPFRLDDKGMGEGRQGGKFRFFGNNIRRALKTLKGKKGT